MKWWIHVSSSVTYLHKTPFCCVETVTNNALNRRRVVVSDRLWANVTPTLNIAFLLISGHAKWWIHCLLISSTPLLSHTTPIYGHPKPEFSIICVCTIAFKVSIPPLNRCFRQSRVRITLIKPLLCLINILSIRKQCFINTRNSDFSFVLKICNSKLVTVVESDLKAPFSIATAPRCREGHCSFP